MTKIRNIGTRFRDKTGTVAVITALLTPLLIGGLSIAIDAAYWRYRAVQLQNAADATALSLALDIKNNITNVALLTVNARNEAKKNGCVGTCSVAVTYPYNANTSNVLVTTTDSAATRFFSFLYSTGQKSLSGRAVASFASSGTGGTLSGSACVLTLMVHTSTTQGIYLNGVNIPASAACEMITDNAPTAPSTAITVNGNSTVNVDLTAAGLINVASGSTVPAAKLHPNHAGVADPYATSIAASNILTLSQFSTTPIQSQCIETVTGGTVTPLDFSRTLATQIFLPASRGYSFSSSGGVVTHNIGGGGGAFCGNFSLADNQIINFGPGIWYMLKNGLATGNSTINATSTTNTVLNAGLPNGGGTTVDGTTIAVYPFGWDQSTFTSSGLNGYMTVVAPTKGPTAGIALSEISSAAASASPATPSWTVGLYYPSTVSAHYSIKGALYTPDYFLSVLGGSVVGAIPGSDGTASTGCSQFITGMLYFQMAALFNPGNNCAGVGVKAFGTIPNTGWQTTSAPASSTGIHFLE